MPSAASVRRAVKLIWHADQHSRFPVAGGVLDQSQNFMDAMDFWASECATWELEKRKDLERRKQ